jgi:16S rRNA (adenine1518-N6/adenine1519-N6)-dimethyltransferase
MPADTAGASLEARKALIGAMPSLRELLDAEGLWARKSLGQHFLLDLNLTRRIVREAGLSSGCHVTEIGPGPGGLTRALAEADIASLTVIERDSRFAQLHRPLGESTGGFLRVIEGDGLIVDPVVETPAPRAIVANLPYNVGTQMLINWLARIGEYESMTLMFQREVADRIVAEPGSKAYGRLSVLCQLCCTVERLMVLPARAFTPPPKIDSAVIRLLPRADLPASEMLANLQKVTAAAFGQRRKMLRSSLKSAFDEPEIVLAEAGILPTARAEEIAPAGFLKLAAAFSKN